MNKKKEQKTTIIRPQTGFFNLNLKEVIEYKDLIFLFAKRNIAVKYKQTVLGPLWLIIMPILSALVSSFVFGDIAKIESDGLPYFLFYFAAFTLWSYFSTSFTSTATTFSSHATLFRKVYFPRLALPISNLLSGLVSFAVHVLLLVIIILIYHFTGTQITPVWGMVWLLPLLLLQTALLALGVGAIFSSITAKYRDLAALIPISVDLWKYLTPVVYTASLLTGGMQIFCLINPMGPVIEAFRYIILGAGGGIFLPYLLLSWAETLIILVVGLLIFHKVERTFVDTV